jgi:hypothetical protein
MAVDQERRKQRKPAGLVARSLACKSAKTCAFLQVLGWVILGWQAQAATRLEALLLKRAQAKRPDVVLNLV